MYNIAENKIVRGVPCGTYCMAVPRRCGSLARGMLSAGSQGSRMCVAECLGSGTNELLDCTNACNSQIAQYMVDMQANAV
jgi:hypothetical protein